jgi:hypothetical protein
MFAAWSSVHWRARTLVLLLDLPLATLVVGEDARLRRPISKAMASGSMKSTSAKMMAGHYRQVRHLHQRVLPTRCMAGVSGTDEQADHQGHQNHHEQALDDVPDLIDAPLSVMPRCQRLGPRGSSQAGPRREGG